jgi:hypothetical protein
VLCRPPFQRKAGINESKSHLTQSRFSTASLPNHCPFSAWRHTEMKPVEDVGRASGVANGHVGHLLELSASAESGRYCQIPRPYNDLALVWPRIARLMDDLGLLFDLGIFNDSGGTVDYDTPIHQTSDTYVRDSKTHY